MSGARGVSRRVMLAGSAAAAAVLLFGSAARLTAEPEYSFVDLTDQINQKLDKNFHNDESTGNNLANLPQGEQTLEGVKYKVGSGVVQLGSSMVKDKPEKVEGIKVAAKAAKLHFFHGTGYGGGPADSEFHVDDGTLIGQYQVNYADQTFETVPIVYAKDVRDWWVAEGGKDEIENGKIAWKGDNEASKQNQCQLRLYSIAWKNPHPDKEVTSITYSSEKTKCAPFLIAVSVEK